MRVVLAFVGIVLVAFAIAAFHTYQLVKLRDYSRASRAQIVRLNEIEAETSAFRRERVKQTAAADLALCVAIEKVKLSESADVRRRLAFERSVKPGPELTQPLLDASIRGLLVRIKELEPIKLGCDTLPSQVVP